MMTCKQATIWCLAAAAMVVSLPRTTLASDWPTRPVTIVVPTAAGGNTDLMARLAADHLSKKLGQQFVVENKPSAGGALATGQVVNAEPDGYTLLFSPSSAVLLTPLVQKIPFNPDELLVPVTNVGTGSQVIAIKESLPIKTLPEFLAYAKERPGKLNFAIAGANNLSHLGPVLLFKRAGVNLVMVPSRGEPQAVNDLMAGVVDFYFGNTSILLPHARAGKVRILGVGTAERLATAPEIPTISETMPGFVFASWNGFFVRKGTPNDIVTRLRSEIIGLVQQDDVKKRLLNLGIIPGGQSEATVEAVFKSDRTNYADAVKAAGIPKP